MNSYDEYGTLGGLHQDLSEVLSLKNNPKSLDFDITFESPLSQFWADEKSAMKLIQNDERVRSIADSQDKIDRKKEEQKHHINAAKRMMMSGCTTRELIDYIKSNFKPEELNDEISGQIRDLFEDLGLLGHVYLDAEPFTCGQLKDFGNKKKARFIIAADKCQACIRNFNSRCPKVSAQLINNRNEIPYEKLYDEYTDQLILAGKIKPGTALNSISGLRQAFLTQPMTKRETITPAAPAESVLLPEKAITEFFNASAENRRNNEKEQNQIEAREVLKICRAIYQSVVKGNDGAILRDQLQKMAIPAEILSKNILVFRRIINDPLLLSRTISYPELFEECRALKEFLNNNNIRTAFLRGHKRCPDCHYNILGHCHLLGCKILDANEKVPQDVIFERIDELRSKKLITSANAIEFKEMEGHQYLTGLQAAIKESKRYEIPPENSFFSTRQSSHQDLPDGILGTTNCQEITYSISESPESAESREIISYFLDYTNDIVIDPPTVKEPVEIDMKNPGASLVVDIAAGDSSRSIDNYQDLFEIAENVIEPDQPRKATAPLDIREIGINGFDISALL
jgi:hypothetical protein